ncbi:uncharacterized protein LOC116956116 isoform X2 [Petromyzon marinus]|uniref:uncharacterized protein LOC116956116 isoform X2 n=1 Tax=Petromyzon marinus TaxID=7757 RepID=UPI003F705C11
MAVFLRWVVVLCAVGVLSADSGFVGHRAANRGLRAIDDEELPPSTVPAGVTYEVQCVNERMSAKIAKSVLLGYGASDLVMNSATPACKLSETGPYITFNISLGECGTFFEETSTDLVFSQTISLPSTTFGIITYDFVYIMVNAICLRDSTVNVTITATARRFTFPAFAFTAQDTKYVYIHAAMIACKASLTASRCQQGCLARRRRSSLETVDTPVYIFTRGPFVYSEDAALSRSEILNYPGVVAIAAVASIILVGLGFASKRMLAKK